MALPEFLAGRKIPLVDFFIWITNQKTFSQKLQ
jgi:hypothetical protein